MKISRTVLSLSLTIMLLAVAPIAFAADPCVRGCAPDRPIPPESVGSLSLPFDLPIWPTLIKTEFHILPWISLGKASVCLPGSTKAIEFPALSLSLKPVPVWFPWLRPLDVECKDNDLCKVP
ncbi:MAG TPA: hypothetical protein VK463_12800 [Desulfomonilaceae bacterium]|nr:hypothetical protein [Desulfomonilaceae bacterium]